VLLDEGNRGGMGGASLRLHLGTGGRRCIERQQAGERRLGWFQGGRRSPGGPLLG
jgi:hypothetical protein